MYLNSKKGFTLIELLVVISIISLLSSIVLTTLNGAKAKARDAVRKSDMLQIKMALDLYYNDHGSYPLAYGWSWGGVSTATSCGANGTTSGSDAYIQGLAPYLPVLPVDPGPQINCSGYLYSSDGANYKLLDHGTPESAPTVGQKFYDPVRALYTTQSDHYWMLCSGEPACGTW